MKQEKEDEPTERTSAWVLYLSAPGAKKLAIVFTLAFLIRQTPKTNHDGVRFSAFLINRRRAEI